MLASRYLAAGDAYLLERVHLDSAIYFFEKSALLYRKHKLWSPYYQCQTRKLESMRKHNELDNARKLAKVLQSEIPGRLGDSHPEFANTQFQLGMLYIMTSQFDSAELYLQKTLSLRLRIFGDQHLSVGDSYFVLGLKSYRMGAFAEALSWYDKAAQMYIKTMGEDYVEIASVYNSMGAIYSYNFGRPDEAGKYHAKALAILEKDPQKNATVIAWTNVCIGMLSEEKGDITEAENYFMKGLSIYKESFGEMSKQVGETYMLLGRTRSLLSDYEQGVAQLEKGLSIMKASGHERTYETGTAYMNLSFIATWQRDWDLAIQHQETGIDIYRQVLPENHAEMARAYYSLAYNYDQKKRYDLAEQYYRKAFTLWSTTMGSDNYRFAAAHEGMGNMYLFKAQYDSAEYHYVKAFDLYKNELGENHPSYGYTLGWLSVFYHIVNDPKAITYFRKANAFYEQYIKLTFSVLGERERDAFYKEFSSHFSAYETFVLDRHKNYPELRGDLYNQRLFTKSILLSTSDKIRRAIHESGDNQIKALYNEVQMLKQQVGAHYLATEKESQTKGKKSLDSLATLLYDRDKELTAKAKKYYIEDPAPDWQKIQAKLGKKEAAVELIRMNTFDFVNNYPGDSLIYVALVLTPDRKEGPEIIILPNGKELESRYLNYYRNSMRSRAENLKSYEHFWIPLKSKLKGIERVYFSADGVYHLINLQSLYNPTSGKYLSDEIEVHQVTSTRELLNQPSLSTTSDEIFLIGSPDFGNDGTVKPGDSVRRSYITPLPGAQEELQKLSELFLAKGWTTTEFTGKDAREIHLHEMENPKVLHIATHGFFQSNGESMSYRKHPFNRSGLLLSGAENTRFVEDSLNGSKEDGVLTAFEAQNLNLNNSELVVLSACETGLGELRDGEGVYGLQRAFKLAGAKSILFSLWKVDDKATQELMINFYCEWLSGKTKRDAFHLAQHNLRKNYSHPYYWAAFVLLGE